MLGLLIQVPAHAREIPPTEAAPIDRSALAHDPLLSGLTPAPAGPSDEVLNEFARLFARSENAEAIKRAEALIEEDPNQVRYWYFLALGHYAQESYEKALEAAEKCQKLVPGWVVTYTLKAAILARLGRFDDIMATFDRAIALEPKNPGVYSQRARLLLIFGPDDPKTLALIQRDLERAAALGATETTLLLLQSELALKRGDTELAQASLEKALAQNPRGLMALGKLVDLYDEHGQSDKSDLALAKASESFTNLTPVAERELAMIRAHHAARSGNHEDADAAYQAALKAVPKDLNVALDYISWLDSHGRIGEGIPLMESLLVEPYHPTLAANLAWAYSEVGRDADAERWIKIARALKPDNPYLSDTEAWIFYRAGNYQRALDTLAPALPYANRVPEIAYHAGAIHWKLGQRKPALDYLERSLKGHGSFNGIDHARALLQTIQAQ